MSSTIPIRTLKSNAGVDFNITVTENVSTTTTIAEAQFQIATEEALRIYGRTIQKAVRKSFQNNKMQYHNSDTTRKYKGGKSPLVETGNLKKAATECNPDDVDVTEVGGAYTLKISWNFPTSAGTGLRPELRKDNSFVYLWSHEFGTTRPSHQIIADGGKRSWRLIRSRPWTIEARPFFMDGIQNGIDEGSGPAAARIASALDLERTSKRAPYVTYMTLKKPTGLTLLPTFFSTSLMGLIWYIVPPSQYYAIIGGVSDLAGALRGSFFSWGIAGNYARAMAVGRMGISKKIIRRRIRGGLWYGGR